MIDWAKWLGISGPGLEILGAVLAVWYTGSKFTEYVRRKANEKLLASLEPPPKSDNAYSPLGISLPTDIPRPEADTDLEPDAVDLLGGRMARWMDPAFEPILNWGMRVVDNLKPLGWLRIPVLAPLGLVFIVLFGALVILLLPVTIVSYVFDLDSDFRLRLIVLAFGIGIILQIIQELIA